MRRLREQKRTFPHSAARALRGPYIKRKWVPKWGRLVDHHGRALSVFIQEAHNHLRGQLPEQVVEAVTPVEQHVAYAASLHADAGAER